MVLENGTQFRSTGESSSIKLTVSCTKCHKLMGQGVQFRNQLWHRECFTCNNCPTILSGSKFTSHDDKPYCFPCYGQIFARKCTSCSKPIYNVGDGFMIHMAGDYWHVSCFACRLCQKQLLGELSVKIDTNIYCTRCNPSNKS